MDPKLFERYSRQILFAEIGEAGQQRLLDSSAVLVGCGALGTVLGKLDMGIVGGHPQQLLGDEIASSGDEGGEDKQHGKLGKGSDGTGHGEVLRDLLEWYPEKAMFGTDLYPNTPENDWEEIGWQTTQESREALAIALTGMMQDGEITRERALQLAHMVLHDNAAKLYGW